jgi:hypothetical protein
VCLDRPCSDDNQLNLTIFSSYPINLMRWSVGAGRARVWFSTDSTPDITE